MKKILNIWFLAVLLALCVGFSSCAEEDDFMNEGNTNPENLIGYWDYLKGGGGMALGDYHIGYGYAELSDIKFNNDGTFEASDANYWNGYYYYGKWEVKGNKLTIFQSYYIVDGVRKNVSATLYREFSIKGDTLKFTAYPGINIFDSLDVYYIRVNE